VTFGFDLDDDQYHLPTSIPDWQFQIVGESESGFPTRMVLAMSEYGVVYLEWNSGPPSRRRYFAINSFSISLTLKPQVADIFSSFTGGNQTSSIPNSQIRGCGCQHPSGGVGCLVVVLV
jgi:hypothetical protein